MGRQDRRPAGPAAAPGLVLDERYRLNQVRATREVAGGAPAVLWRAVDQPLERTVAVLLVGGLRRDAQRRLVSAAARASHVTDARFVRVLDTGTIALDTGTTTWIATEWVEAPSLAATWRQEPLPVTTAAEIVRQCAQALAVADRAGCHHLRLHADQVLLPTGGVPRITGLEVAAALHDVTADDPAREDARQLGALLDGLVRAHRADHHEPAAWWRSVRRSRAGAGRDIDAIARHAATGSYPDPAAVARALSTLPSRPLDTPATDETDGPRMWRRWAWRIVPPLVVLAIGITGWSLGSDLGRVPMAARRTHAALPPAQASAGSGRATLVWHRPPVITSFDPEGDGTEDEDAVALAVDRDPTTAWETARYRGNPRFGGLKSGVGLLVDLRHPTTVSVAELALTTAGAAVQIRAGDARPQAADDLPVVASSNNADAHLQLDLAQPVRARYWLIWFTSLPGQPGGYYQEGVAELALLGSADH